MSERPARTREFVLLGVAGSVVCCGLPLLLAAGAGVTVVGIGLRSWALILCGGVAAIAGFVMWRRRRSSMTD